MIYKNKITSIVFILFILAASISCKKKVTTYPQMESFYEESCNLTGAREDSVGRFNSKFIEFTNKHSDAVEDARYPYILENTFLVVKNYQDKRKELMEYLELKRRISNSRYKNLPDYLGK